MSEQWIAQQLLRITKLDSKQFEKHLSKLRDQPNIIRFLGDLLASDYSDDQKTLAAVGINYILVSRLEEDYKKWPNLWNEFYETILCHPEINAIQWRHLNITNKILQKVMDEFQSQLCNILNPIFPNLNLKCKTLIYQSFSYIQMTEQIRYIFIRETVENYIKSILNFICDTHDRHIITPDSLKLEQSILEHLHLLLRKLQKYQTYQKINKMMCSLSANQDLFLLIIQQLLYEPSKLDYASVLKRDFQSTRMGELVLMCELKQQPLCDRLNELKSNVIKILTTSIKRYERKSMIEEFDYHKYLHFMENLCPIVIELLIKMATNQKWIHDRKQNVISLLQFLGICCSFNFLLQLFESNLQKIFFQICLPLLSIDQQELQSYKNNGQDFISISQQLTEFNEQKNETVKNYAGLLLQQLIKTVDGSLNCVVQICCNGIRHILGIQKQEMIILEYKKYGCKLSIQSLLMILTILSAKCHERDDLVNVIKEKILKTQEIIKLQKVDKARLLIFLAYNYETYYNTSPQEGTNFLLLANKGLDENDTMIDCSLLLFQNCINLGFGGDIWYSLITRITNTTSIKIFSLIKTIVKDMMDQLPFDKLKELLEKVIQRLIVEYRKCNEISLQNTVQGNQFVYKCLNIIQQISQNSKYIKQEDNLIECIWPIFDLFEFSHKIQFEDNILDIFNNILSASKKFTHEYFMFFDYFIVIHEKHRKFKNLVKTYTLMLTNGRSYFLSDRQGAQDLQKLAKSLQGCYTLYKTQQSLKLVCIFFHFIYNEYSSILKKDCQFIENLQQIYYRTKNEMKYETLAALINLIIITQINYGNCNMNIIKQNPINIFKGYQSKLFSQGLRKLIQKYWENQESLEYLRYAIRLLHFLRDISLSKIPEKTGYFTPQFVDFASIDPFFQICQALDFLKRSLDPNRYDFILEKLSNEISLGQIKDLLSRRVVDRNLRVFVKIKSN